MLLNGSWKWAGKRNRLLWSKILECGVYVRTVTSTVLRKLLIEPNCKWDVYLWNIGKLLPDYMVHHPRRQSFADLQFTYEYEKHSCPLIGIYFETQVNYWHFVISNVSFIVLCPDDIWISSYGYRPVPAWSSCLCPRRTSKVLHAKVFRWTSWHLASALVSAVSLPTHSGTAARLSQHSTVLQTKLLPNNITLALPSVLTVLWLWEYNSAYASIKFFLVFEMKSGESLLPYV
jgi:hypothetical protein